VPIGHVTNGVHSQTWLAPEMRPLYNRYLRPRWVPASPADDCWRNADRIPPAALWHVRNQLRRRLVHFIRARLRQQIERRCEPLAELAAACDAFDENTLTIGFARRFATYKRAPLIFNNPRRLADILNDPRRPVQIVFAGKAHPADREGQAYAQRIYQFAMKSGFRGRVVLLEDYDMHIGRLLTSGCDVWLNNPIPPMEASGTSGMKPPLHGGLNLSILDGWWPEAYNGRNGWAIGGPDMPRVRSDRARDRRDARLIYQLLEDEVVPQFYTRDREDLPRRWIQRMVASMKTVCGQFNTHRMLAQYLERYAGT
jgi:starch phosphorylase